MLRASLRVGVAATFVAVLAAPGCSKRDCRNSYDERCGRFRYDPSVTNRPMRIDIGFEPQRPRVGQQVTFTIHARDDGPIASDSCAIDFDPGWHPDGVPPAPVQTCPVYSCASPPPGKIRYGRWDPPARQNGELTITRTATYGEAGAFTVSIAFNRASSCDTSPYRSGGKDAEASAVVQVIV